MKFLQLLEKAWLAAIVAAFGLGIYFLFTKQALTSQVYIAFMCAIFSALIYHNIKSQRKFLEERNKNK
ncbi:MAG: hypothetical protein JNL95_05965 [Chitinophagales bacterium]|nr:hypothetical protein [Chitinophagales bacterium]